MRTASEGRSSAEQAQLLRRRLRRPEMLGRGLHAGRVEAEPLAGNFEAAADHPRDRTGAGHPLAPIRIVVLAAAGIADELEHVVVAVRKILFEPFTEEVSDFQRQ